MAWNKFINKDEIKVKVTNETVLFAQEFGTYLGQDGGKGEKHLTTNQLRKFFGEVKRQELNGYDPTEFILLKPKLAYAVGRDKNTTKIKDFYKVMSNAIDAVTNENEFNNFIKIFEAIVAYHKASEENANI